MCSSGPTCVYFEDVLFSVAQDTCAFTLLEECGHVTNLHPDDLRPDRVQTAFKPLCGLNCL